MSPKTVVSKEILAHDLRTALHGKLDNERIDHAVRSLATTTASYPANGSVASLIFYLQFQVTITSPGGKAFNGIAGGLSIPGGGPLFGDVLTDNINALYANTHGLAFTATPAYLAIYFYDSSSNYLGAFQSVAVSTVLGTGGGTGSWS